MTSGSSLLSKDSTDRTPRGGVYDPIDDGALSSSGLSVTPDGGSLLSAEAPRSRWRKSLFSLFM